MILTILTLLMIVMLLICLYLAYLGKDKKWMLMFSGLIIWNAVTLLERIV